MIKWLLIPLCMALLSACGSSHIQMVEPNNASQLLSEKIAKEVHRLPGVTGVTSIVQGNNIMVGINSKEGLDLSSLQRNLESKFLGFNIRVTQENNG